MNYQTDCTSMVTIDSIRVTLQTADAWQRKGEPTWVSNCLSSALMEYLHLALIEQNDAESGVRWLLDQGFASVLQRYLAVLQAVDAKVSAGKLPISTIGGNYHYLVFAHAAWCVNEFQLGESFVEFSEKAGVLQLSTPFWREYSNGMAALVRRDRFQSNELRIRGQEKYWMKYVRLVEARCNSEPVDIHISEINEAFSKRNHDKRINDSYQIEGSGFQAVNWNFRLQGLLRYFEHRR